MAVWHCGTSHSSQLVMKCSERVFRCFRAVERLGDRVTGAAGPFFVGLAVILLSLAIFTFCKSSPALKHHPTTHIVTVIQPDLPWPWLTTPICLLIATNLMANYYYACIVPPGFVNAKTPFEESTFLSRLRRHNHSARSVHWSEERNMSRARVSKCRKCGLQRPEVSKSLTASVPNQELSLLIWREGTSLSDLQDLRAKV